MKKSILKNINQLQVALNGVLVTPSDKDSTKFHLNKFASHANGLCDHLELKSQNRLIKILQLSRKLVSDESESATLKSGIEKNWKAFQKTLV